jgi:hypothetical protein
MRLESSLKRVGDDESDRPLRTQREFALTPTGLRCPVVAPQVDIA